MARIYRLANKVREARKTAGYSQPELARLINTTAAYISHLECGRVSPNVTTIIKLSRALKSPLAWFFA
jgi:transcriptional regulator with XRE-family HTH domain